MGDDDSSARKRDKRLQRLLLLQQRDGKALPELAAYSKEQKTYNSALLIKDGYCDGNVVPNAHGFYAHAILLEITSKGHDFLDETETPTQGSSGTAAGTPETAPDRQFKIKITGAASANSTGVRDGTNPQTVFVVHGRNMPLRDSLFDFLRAIGLKPLEWSQAVAATGKGSPYVGEVLDKAFSMARAVVVLMTPDDEACLRKEFQTDHDPVHEKELTGQARPNVLFEAGMAMGWDADRTVLVEVGVLRPFSDIGGRHAVRLDDSATRRHDLAERLRTAGCAVDTSGTDWLGKGSFALQPSKGVAAGDAHAITHNAKHKDAERFFGSLSGLVESIGVNLSFNLGSHPFHPLRNLKQIAAASNLPCLLEEHDPTDGKRYGKAELPGCVVREKTLERGEHLISMYIECSPSLDLFHLTAPVLDKWRAQVEFPDTWVLRIKLNPKVRSESLRHKLTAKLHKEGIQMAEESGFSFEGLRFTLGSNAICLVGLERLQDPQLPKLCDRLSASGIFVTA